ASRPSYEPNGPGACSARRNRALSLGDRALSLGNRALSGCAASLRNRADCFVAGFVQVGIVVRGRAAVRLRIEWQGDPERRALVGGGGPRGGSAGSCAAGGHH